MTVTVDHVEKVRDSLGELIYDTKHQSMLLPRVAFDDAETVPVEGFEGWWEKQEPILRDQLTSLLADPGPARLQEDVKSGLVIMIPIPRKLLWEGSNYDVMGELLPEIKEATLMRVRELQGDHTHCPKIFEDSCMEATDVS